MVRKAEYTVLVLCDVADKPLFDKIKAYLNAHGMALALEWEALNLPKEKKRAAAFEAAKTCDEVFLLATVANYPYCNSLVLIGYAMGMNKRIVIADLTGPFSFIKSCFLLQGDEVERFDTLDAALSTFSAY
jgi:hypothetical protein